MSSHSLLLDPVLRKAIDEYLDTIREGLPEIKFTTKMGLKGTTLTIGFDCFGMKSSEDKAEISFAREPNSPIQELEIANLVMQAIGTFLGQVLIVRMRLPELSAKPKILVP
jgi:hypothetical protein